MEPEYISFCIDCGENLTTDTESSHVELGCQIDSFI